MPATKTQAGPGVVTGKRFQNLLIEPHAPGDQASVVARHAQGHDGLVATWATEYGPLNRLLTLRDAPEEGAATESTGAPDDWLAPRTMLRRLEVRRPLKTDLLAKPLHELRLYAARPGRCEEFVSALLGALPFRERYSPCAAVWTTRERGVDLTVHLWAYDSLEQRMAARDAALKDADWSNYRASIRPLLENLQAWLLTSVPLPPKEQT